MEEGVNGLGWRDAIATAPDLETMLVVLKGTMAIVKAEGRRLCEASEAFAGLKRSIAERLEACGMSIYGVVVPSTDEAWGQDEPMELWPAEELAGSIIEAIEEFPGWVAEHDQREWPSIRLFAADAERGLGWHYERREWAIVPRVKVV
jgi:hypothetical protein